MRGVYRLFYLTLIGIISATSIVFAATKKETPKWDVNAAHGKVKTVKFTTEEGTWLDLDVRDDGAEIVFSMLGDIYVLPIAGGKARRITSGAAWDVQPRYSPDGKQIAFTSDRGGGNNIWRMKADGSGASAVSKEDFRLLNNPIWTPDGNYLVARKHFTSERSLGAGELWLYHTGGGAGLQLTKKKNDQQDLGEPSVSPDGRYIYFSEDVSAGPNFQYNKNPHDVIYAIKQLDRDSGEIEVIESSGGGAVRPQISPDGKRLAFVKRVGEQTVLHVMDLASGEIKPLWDSLSHDQQEAWAIFGSYPNFDWLPDGSDIIIWAKGKIWRINSVTGNAKTISFNAEVEQTISNPIHYEQKLARDQFTSKMIRDVATSPDQKTIVFHAVGQLWTKTLPDGKPVRLSTQNEHFEYQASFSSDGKKLVYTTWDDVKQGAIRERDLQTGMEKTVSHSPGFYYSPRYSNNGKYLIWSKQAGGAFTGSLNSNERGIWMLDLEKNQSRRIAKDGFEPQFNSDASRVYFLTGGGLSKKLQSVGLHGEEPRDVFSLKYIDFVSISPDGNWIAFTELFNAYLAPMPKTGSVIELSKDAALPITRVSTDVGSYLHWSSDSKSVHWMVGDQYYSRELKDAFVFVDGAPAKLPEAKTAKAITVGLSVAVDTPKERMAFVNARVISMKGDEVIENATVLINGDRIEAVGKDISIPKDARVVDVSGKTIIPGLIDVHAHAGHFSSGVVPESNWSYYANLAFGFTTLHDPSATTETVFSQAELQRAGRLVGPRIFSTGTILYGADGDFKAEINSIDDARAHLRRMKANGAFSVKSYNQPRREQHQMVNQAAHELGMLVVEEGGSTFNHNMPMILDGATSIEHNIPIAPLYNDVISLWKQTDVRNTPTLVVTYGGLNGEFWWYARDQVWQDKKLNRFFPKETLRARAVRRETAPDWDYYHIEVAKSVKQLQDNGIKVQIGGHGQLQGLASHWEIWMFVQGGMSPQNALRAATIDGADLLGMASELGSIEVGKRADLVVLNNNPLDAIRATADTRYVMVNGRLFDVDADMAEIGNRQTPAPEFYWQRHRDGRNFGVEYGPAAKCLCPKSALSHTH